MGRRTAARLQAGVSALPQVATTSTRSRSRPEAPAPDPAAAQAPRPDTQLDPRLLSPPLSFFQLQAEDEARLNLEVARAARDGSPESVHSAYSVARRAAEDTAAADNEDDGSDSSDEEDDDETPPPPMQANIVGAVFDAADAAAKDEEDDTTRKNGRQEGSLQWTGPELRALLTSMAANDVFDPTLSVDERAQAWLDTVSDVNKWNQLHPRKCGRTAERSAVRTVEACDSKWRRSLYPAIKKGQKASEIASGPSEEDDDITSYCDQLKYQWEQYVRHENVKREAKKKAKDPEKARALDARDRATAALEKLDDSKGVKRELDESEDDPLTAKSDGKKTKRLRALRSDASTAELTGAVAEMAAQQVADAAAAREQQQQQHEEQLRMAERARELERQKHRDSLQREDRRIAIQERMADKEHQTDARVASVETKLDQVLALLLSKQP